MLSPAEAAECGKWVGSPYTDKLCERAEPSSVVHMPDVAPGCAIYCVDHDEVPV